MDGGVGNAGTVCRANRFEHRPWNGQKLLLREMDQVPERIRCVDAFVGRSELLANGQY